MKRNNLMTGQPQRGHMFKTGNAQIGMANKSKIGSDGYGGGSPAMGAGQQSISSGTGALGDVHYST